MTGKPWKFENEQAIIDLIMGVIAENRKKQNEEWNWVWGLGKEPLSFITFSYENRKGERRKYVSIPLAITENSKNKVYAIFRIVKSVCLNEAAQKATEKNRKKREDDKKKGISKRRLYTPFYSTNKMWGVKKVVIDWDPWNIWEKITGLL